MIYSNCTIICNETKTIQSIAAILQHYVVTNYQIITFGISFPRAFARDCS